MIRKSGSGETNALPEKSDTTRRSRKGASFFSFTGGVLTACIAFVLSNALSPTIETIGQNIAGLQPHFAVEIPRGSHSDQVSLLFSNFGLGTGVVRWVKFCPGAATMEFPTGKRSSLSLSDFKEGRENDPNFEPDAELVCFTDFPDRPGSPRIFESEYLTLAAGSTDLSLAPGEAKLLAYRPIQGVTLRSVEFSDTLGRNQLSEGRGETADRDCVVVVAYSDRLLSEDGYRRTLLARCLGSRG